MKKITKILIAIALLLTAISVNAQDICYVICHQGKVAKVVGFHALQGHLLGHDDDFLGFCEEYLGVIGEDCVTLSVKKINFKYPIPAGLEYTITDIIGKIRKRGVTDEKLYSSLPKQEMLFLHIKQYQTLKFYKKN